jgi:hypothetical protein
MRKIIRGRMEGKVNGNLVCCLPEAICAVMKDGAKRSPQQMLTELEKWDIKPTRQGLHKAITFLIEDDTLTRIKYGKYKYVSPPRPLDVIMGGMLKEAMEEQRRKEILGKTPPTEDNVRERLAKLFAEGKLITRGKGKE